VKERGAASPAGRGARAAGGDVQAAGGGLQAKGIEGGGTLGVYSMKKASF